MQFHGKFGIYVFFRLKNPWKWYIPSHILQIFLSPYSSWIRFLFHYGRKFVIFHGSVIKIVLVPKFIKKMFWFHEKIEKQNPWKWYIPEFSTIIPKHLTNHSRNLRWIGLRIVNKVIHITIIVILFIRFNSIFVWRIFRLSKWRTTGLWRWWTSSNGRRRSWSRSFVVTSVSWLFIWFTFVDNCRMKLRAKIFYRKKGK